MVGGLSMKYSGAALIESTSYSESIVCQDLKKMEIFIFGNSIFNLLRRESLHSIIHLERGTYRKLETCCIVKLVIRLVLQREL